MTEIPEERLTRFWEWCRFHFQIQYCAGFTRGENNNLICWSKTLPPEECLSPVCDDPAIALFLAIEQIIGETNE